MVLFFYQLPTTLSSLVWLRATTVLSLLSTSNYVSDVCDWQNFGTDVTKPWRRKKDNFHVPKPWPHCHFVKWPTKNWVLFWGWNVHIWWPAHRKTIRPTELRRKLDKKTWNPLQNAKRHRIHKHQNGNAATFNYLPGGMILNTFERWHPICVCNSSWTWQGQCPIHRCAFPHVFFPLLKTCSSPGLLVQTQVFCKLCPPRNGVFATIPT